MPCAWSVTVTRPFSPGGSAVPTVYGWCGGLSAAYAGSAVVELTARVRSSAAALRERRTVSVRPRVQRRATDLLADARLREVLAVVLAPRRRAVGQGDHDVPVAVDDHVVEVEQVAPGQAGRALGAHRSALDRVGRRRVVRLPGPAAVGRV